MSNSASAANSPPAPASARRNVDSAYAPGQPRPPRRAFVAAAASDDAAAARSPSMPQPSAPAPPRSRTPFPDGQHPSLSSPFLSDGFDFSHAAALWGSDSDLVDPDLQSGHRLGPFFDPFPDYPQDYIPDEAGPFDENLDPPTVDNYALTFDPSGVPSAMPLPHSSSARKRSFVDIDSISSSPGPSRPTKRPKPSSAASASNTTEHQASSSSSQPQNRPAVVEQIDLVDDESPLETTLRKQLEDQVKAQQLGSASSAQSKLTSLTCTVCLDSIKELTATQCGHTFCHSCLMDWLVSAEKTDSRRTNCPACRAKIQRVKKTGPQDVIPLEIMKRSVGRYQPAGRT